MLVLGTYSPKVNDYFLSWAIRYMLKKYAGENISIEIYYSKISPLK